MVSVPASGQSWGANAARELLARLVAQGFRGYDPYDGLNARLLSSLTRGSLLGRRVVTQAVKRSPVLLQPLVGAPPSVSATTMGYSLLACARLARMDELPGEWASLVPRMAGFAKQLAVVGSRDELAWGSHADVATRFGFTPVTTPNVVVSAVAAHGLAAVTRAGLCDERPALRRVAQFIMERLGRRTRVGERWFSYTPDGKTMIHNGSMLAAATLMRCGAVLEDGELVNQGLSAARTVVAYQQGDGSWAYAEHAEGRWVDSFHTGFILEALLQARRHEQSELFVQALDAGGRHYAENFFGPQGQPWYSAVQHYPLDAMSAAQGLEVLPWLACVVPAANGVAECLSDWCRAHLLRLGGRVAFQVHRHWSDGRQFPRWSTAPMAAALAGVNGFYGCTSGGSDVAAG